MFLEKRNGGTEMLECEIEIGKEEQDALLEIALNSKEYRKKSGSNKIFDSDCSLYFDYNMESNK